MQIVKEKSDKKSPAHQKNGRFENMVKNEWLLTNSRGGFASGTICDCNTRRYHSYLTGTLRPPGNRIAGLCGCDEKIYCNRAEYGLSHFEFEPASDKAKQPLPERFRKDIGVHFDYSTAQFEMTKSIYLAAESDIVAIVYNFKEIEEAFEFSVRPMTAMRDFHSLSKASDAIYVEWIDDMPAVRNRNRVSEQLILYSDEMAFHEDGQWWNNFSYRVEKQRGFDFTEDLFSPGVFHRTIDGPVKIVLWAGLGDDNLPGKIAGFDVDVMCDDLKLRQKAIIHKIRSRDENVQALAAAADEFVIERVVEKVKLKSIMAGFPWFLDWGRDAMIALPGILLCTGRHEDAANVLMNFAFSADEGMIPNCFDDYNNGAVYNSIDASLWFIHASFEYYRASGDMRIFSSKLMPIVRWIIDSYRLGTRYNIKVDADGLIRGGDENTQLTWMDANSNGRACTPRWGRAVEINALWYNALCNVAEFYKVKNPVLARNFSQSAGKVADSFRKTFWYEQGGYLYDCVRDDGSCDASLRPNQIFAVSLPFSPLNDSQKISIVEIVMRELLTPYGLRSLSRGDSRYCVRYEGDPSKRDAAYHQGTVWPWLIGHFIEAYLKVSNFNRSSRKDASDMLSPLVKHLWEDGCIGSISEIFDGDTPHRPRGAYAQAWSVAEVLRAYLLINSKTNQNSK